MGMRRIFTVIMTVVLVTALGVLSLPTLTSNAHLGLDLKGGVMVRLEAPEGTSDEDMLGAMAVIDQRINGLGVTEPEIRREGENRISVELPGVEDPEEAVRLIGKTAVLEFVRVDTEQVIVSGSDLKQAQANMNQQALTPTDRYVVGIEFNKAGAQQFAQATTELVKKYGPNDPNRSIAIVLDGEVISAPMVNEPITNGQAAISGNFPELEEAQNLAMLLNSGALPVELKVIEKRTVGPQLGADSIDKSKTAALYGIAALILFMVVYYRIPGIVSAFSLLVYALLVAGVLVLINASITLPAIAGFLLSMGMAVDANVIIFERIKEELRAGKSIRVAVDAGFKKAFSTILDSNVTTLIGTLVLIFFSTGTVKGFAVTLAIGIVASMFTAVVFTRFILKQLALSNVIKNNKLYGA